MMKEPERLSSEEAELVTGGLLVPEYEVKKWLKDPEASLQDAAPAEK